jgi:heterodisulfide reductase subunit A
MLDVARNENIKLYTYAEVSKISGYIGNFSVEIYQKARYITNDCNGCGACMDVCPAHGHNEFNQYLNPRPAIYISFPQAVPSIAQIDMNKCIKCGLCKNICELDAIDFDQKDEKINIKVGTIIVATGWDEYIPEDGYLGYKQCENVITQLQLERILAPNGPSGGHLVRPSDGKEPKRVLFIQCVGSRDLNRNIYCSSGVCCMISIKNSKLIKQHYPDTEITVAYMDMRAAGKYYEEYYTASRKEGVKYLRSNISRVFEDPETKNLRVLVQDTLRESLGIKEMEYDLIVLSAAMIPNYDIGELNKILNLEVTPDGFFKEIHARLNPIDTKIPGISLAGVAQGPKSIAESIMQAGGAASSAGKLMKQGKFKINLIIAEVDKEKCSKCELCVLNCPYEAIKLVEDGAEVDEITCRGCGSCLANCPSEAITLRYYREAHYEDQIDALLEVLKEEVT